MKNDYTFIVLFLIMSSKNPFLLISFWAGAVAFYACKGSRCWVTTCSPSFIKVGTYFSPTAWAVIGWHSLGEGVIGALPPKAAMRESLLFIGEGRFLCCEISSYESSCLLCICCVLMGNGGAKSALFYDSIGVVCICINWVKNIILSQISH
jgi:hypothetical protein